MTPELLQKYTDRAAQHVEDIVNKAIEHPENQTILVISDTEFPLTEVITNGYKKSFPHATFMTFTEESKDEVRAALDETKEGDLVVLVQSADFRLDEFRIRLHLFNKSVKVIEHRHLNRNTGDMFETYIESLAYDPLWYRGEGGKLKELLSNTEELRVKSHGAEFTVTEGLENAKPNLGDYSEMKNIGGAFPIGEVFTEAKDLHSANGSLRIYAFADVNFNIAFHEPFTINIVDGIVSGWDDKTPQAFVDVIEKIKTNERPILRELGFGMNKGITREKPLNDITAFERIQGMHVSIGEKHTVYKKEGITAKKTRFHVDLFVDVEEISSDGTVFLQNNTYNL